MTIDRPHPFVSLLLAAGACLALLGSARLPAAPRNIAAEAKITANSEHSGPHRARFVADGKIAALGGRNDAGNAWAVNGSTHANGAELTFTWPRPMPIAEVVYYSRSAHAVEGWREYAVYVGGAAKPAVKGRLKSGHGPQRIALGSVRTAGRLRLKFTSSFGGANPGASEVQVWTQTPAAKALGKFIPLPPYVASSRRRSRPR